MCSDVLENADQSIINRKLVGDFGSLLKDLQKNLIPQRVVRYVSKLNRRDIIIIIGIDADEYNLIWIEI